MKAVEPPIVDPMATPESVSPPLVCDLSAIDASNRIRHRDLLLKLRAASRDWRETTDGYSFRVVAEEMPLMDVAEWMGLERLCCPFLNLALEVAGGQEDCWLTITGPAGAKPIVKAELGPNFV